LGGQVGRHLPLGWNNIPSLHSRQTSLLASEHFAQLGSEQGSQTPFELATIPIGQEI
jgi:hypothetical protein